MNDCVPNSWTGKLVCVGDGLLTGEASSLIVRPALIEAGFQPRDCAFVGVGGKKNMRDIRKHRPKLLAFLRDHPSDLIMGFGVPALRALLDVGVGSLTAWRGKEISIPGLDAHGYATVTFHPDAALMQGQFFRRGMIASDLHLLTAPKLEYPENVVPPSWEKTVGFDTEFDPNGKLLTVGTAITDMACAADVGPYGELNEYIKKSVEGASYIVGHSVPGDIDYLVKLGIAKEEWCDGTHILDSLLLARMQDENKREKGSYSLGNLLRSYFRVKDWKEETDKIIKKEGDARAWTKEQREERCRLDSWASFVLARMLWKKLTG